ncbi:MAG: hypothetical protein P1V97_34245 [Planctomycetota bacterium]|nr:hypothetical protein [Planctomycetota bacterium]
MSHEVLQEATKFLNGVESWLEKDDKQLVQIYLFKSYKDFQKTMKAKGEGITYYGCCQPVVAIPHWPMEFEDKPDHFVTSVLETVGSDWRFRLRHELIHVVFRDATGLQRDWLWEGVADYFAHGGHLGDGMKAQRFLSLKKAMSDEKLHSFNELRQLRINASRDEADLLYAEAWSVIYTLMNLCGIEVREKMGLWLRDGAPGTLEDALKGTGWTVAKVDALRYGFIVNFRCLIEAGEMARSNVAYESGLRDGDCILQLEGFPIQRISDRKDLGMYLSYLFHPPSSLERYGYARCLIQRNQRLLVLTLPTEVLKTIPWRLTARLERKFPQRRQHRAPIRLVSMKGG